MNRRRDLSAEEATLWSGIARSIKPLRPAKRAVKPAANPVANPAAKPAAKPVDRGDDAPPPPRAAAKSRLPTPAKSPPLAPFDRRLKQRVARGREAIDARLDLHGLTQSEAHAALLRFLRRAQSEGARITLVVTGKGDRESERGVLRRQVPQWLALPEFRPFVVGFEEAHVSHGGEGALYIRLRRAR